MFSSQSLFLIQFRIPTSLIQIDLNQSVYGFLLNMITHLQIYTLRNISYRQGMIKSIVNTAKQSIKDPKILTALAIGFLAPRVLSVVSRKLGKMLRAKQEHQHLYVGIELGGTNYNIAFGKPEFDKNGDLIQFKLLKQVSGRVTDRPEDTLNEIANAVNDTLSEKQKIYFVGISCFGPLELNKNSPKYGYITSTPKPGWRDTPVLTLLKQKISCKQFSIETDVNAAAYAELKLANHKVHQSLVYVTVGTGVGVGVITHNMTVHGLTHPEGGHIIVKRHAKEYEGFQGVCPFHGDCLEGMVANRSISKRTGVDFAKLHEIEDVEKIWEIIGYYLAQLCLNVTLTVSPQRIIIGGGIMNRKVIYKYIHEYFLIFLAEYVEHPLFTQENVHNYIVAPVLGSTVGVKGALLLKFL